MVRSGHGEGRQGRKLIREDRTCSGARHGLAHDDRSAVTAEKEKRKIARKIFLQGGMCPISVPTIRRRDAVVGIMRPAPRPNIHLPPAARERDYRSQLISETTLQAIVTA